MKTSINRQFEGSINGVIFHDEEQYNSMLTILKGFESFFGQEIDSPSFVEEVEKFANNSTIKALVGQIQTPMYDSPFIISPKQVKETSEEANDYE